MYHGNLKHTLHFAMNKRHLNLNVISKHPQAVPSLKKDYKNTKNFYGTAIFIFVSYLH